MVHLKLSEQVNGVAQRVPCGSNALQLFYSIYPKREYWLCTPRSVFFNLFAAAEP